MTYHTTPNPKFNISSIASKGGGLSRLAIGVRDTSRTRYARPIVRGDGYLAGKFPVGITTVNGVPTTAVVRALWRDPAGGVMDGYVVASTTSAPDGTWLLSGLDPTQKYDIVGRKDGYNDVIMANVSPKVD